VPLPLRIALLNYQCRCQRKYARAEYRELPDQHIDTLVRAAALSKPRVLVLPMSEPATTRGLVTELLARIDCSLLVVR
jgi:hypothetical protein